MDVNRKLMNVLSDGLASSKVKEIYIAQNLTEEHYDVQARFLNIAIAYIYTMAGSESRGIVRADLYELAKLCSDIKNYALDNIIEPEAYRAEVKEYISL